MTTRELHAEAKRASGETDIADAQLADLSDGSSSESRQIAEDVDPDGEGRPPLDPRSYQAQPVWQRMIIISAGVIMNIITGILFAAIAYGFGVSMTPSLIGRVSPGGPAWQAGMQPGGRVVQVGRQSDPQMSFRKMQTEILTQGLSEPDETIAVAVKYPDAIKNFDLRLISHPAEEDLHLIGIASPQGTRLAEIPAVPGTVAATVLDEDLGGWRLVSFDGTAIDPDAMVPALPFVDHLYRHPGDDIEMVFQAPKPASQEGAGSAAAPERRTVTLPPQTAKTLGIDFSIGPIDSVIQGGAAEQAGLQAGDVIVSVDGQAVKDPWTLVQKTLDADAPVQMQVRRGDQTVDLTITPEDRPQTSPPGDSLTGVLAINRLGFAFRPVARVSETDVDGFAAGDMIRRVVMTTPIDELPDDLKANPDDETPIGRLAAGWDISPKWSWTQLDETLQALPSGTEFEITVERGSQKDVVTAAATLREDSTRFAFERGLVMPTEETIRKAADIGDAMQLGYEEGRDRFVEVVDFLRMAVTGRLKFRHVGGPLQIFSVAKSEAEKGISRQLIFLTLLSMNLAILNFMPIPGLDGGHMMFLTYELVTGRRPNEAVEYRLTIVGFVLLMTLMVLVFFQDLARLVF